MKRKQLERLGYLKPECEIIETITEQFVCASVRPDAGLAQRMKTRVRMM